MSQLANAEVAEAEANVQAKEPSTRNYDSSRQDGEYGPVRVSLSRRRARFDERERAIADVSVSAAGPQVNDTSSLTPLDIDPENALHWIY